MGGKGKTKRNSKDSTPSNAGSGEAEDKKKESGGGGKKKGPTSKSIGCDIFNDAAMENAYYVCHNVQVSNYRNTVKPGFDVLKTRGFAWPDGQKKKKKGKR